MKTEQSPEELRKVAMALDNALENRDIDKILSSFADNCEIEILRQQLVGKEGVRKWINWLYKNFRQVKFQPVIIMVEGDTLFEEFIIRARLHSGIEVKSKQSEVLVYENYKIKSLRIYFDRLDFAEMLTKWPINKVAVSQIIKKSLDGLT